MEQLFSNAQIRDRSQIKSRFRSVVEEFVTVQIQENFLYGKFETRGSKKIDFLCYVIYE